MTERESFTPEINTESLRTEATTALSHFQDVLRAKLKDQGIGQTLVNAYKGLERDQRDALRADNATIEAFGGYANDYLREFETPEAYDEQIKIKAKKYSEERAEAQDRADQIRNYFDGLMDKADQTLAVRDVFNHLTEQVESLNEITLADKQAAAYTLAEEIRAYGGMIHSVDGRKELVEKGIISEQKLAAILRSNLVVGAEDNTPKHNLEGYRNDEEWNKAVFKTASGLLEAEWLQKLTAVAHLNLDSKILEAAQQVYEKRTSPEVIEEEVETEQEVVEPKDKVSAGVEDDEEPGEVVTGPVGEDSEDEEVVADPEPVDERVIAESEDEARERVGEELTAPAVIEVEDSTPVATTLRSSVPGRVWAFGKKLAEGVKNGLVRVKNSFVFGLRRGWRTARSFGR